MEVLMDPVKAATVNKPKRKRKAKLTSNTLKTATDKTEPNQIPQPNVPINITRKKIKKVEDPTEIAIKYPILKNELLVQRFLNVSMTNNQKGRIRQAIRESLQGSSNAIVPDIVHNKIQSIIRDSPVLTDSQLRRIRILYNILTKSLKGESIDDSPKLLPPPKSPLTLPPPKLLLPPKSPLTLPALNKSPRASKTPPLETIKEKPQKKLDKTNELNPEKKAETLQKKDQLEKKVRGPKRYVVFLGNLPLAINKEKILSHFSEMNEHILNIRIPKTGKEEKKSAIAFMELSNEASYEFALSKHHSMLDRKRINVLYTAQKHGRVSAADAKSKAAKLIALQKSGKLVGSTPLIKKRSQRRLKKKLAEKKLAEANEAPLI